MSNTKVYEVPHEVLIQAPPGLLTEVAKQLERWFYVDSSVIDLQTTDLRVRVNDNTPPEWVLMLEALQVAHWDTVRTAIGVLKAVRKDSIRRRGITARITGGEAVA